MALNPFMNQPQYGGLNQFNPMGSGASAPNMPPYEVAPPSGMPRMPSIPGPPPKAGLPAWWLQFLQQGIQSKAQNYENQIANLKPGQGVLSPQILQALNQIRQNELNRVQQSYQQNKSGVLMDLYGRNMAQSTSALDEGNRLGEFLSRGRSQAEADYGNQLISAMNTAYQQKLDALKTAAGLQGEGGDREYKAAMDAYAMQQAEREAQYQYLWRKYNEQMSRYQQGYTGGGQPQMQLPIGFQLPPHEPLPDPFGPQGGTGTSQTDRSNIILGGKRGNDNSMYPPPMEASAPVPDAASPMGYPWSTGPRADYNAMGYPWSQGPRGNGFQVADNYMHAPRGGPDLMTGGTSQGGYTGPARGGGQSIFRRGVSGGGGAGGGGGTSGGGSRSQQNAIKKLLASIKQNSPVGGPNPAANPFDKRGPKQQDVAAKLAVQFGQTILPEAMKAGGYQTKNALGLISAILNNAGLGSLGTYGANEGAGHVLFTGGGPVGGGVVTALRTSKDTGEADKAVVMPIFTGSGGGSDVNRMTGEVPQYTPSAQTGNNQGVYYDPNTKTWRNY